MAQLTTVPLHPAFSKTIRHNDLFFIPAQTGAHPATGKLPHESIESEARQLVQNLGAVLAAEGLRYEQLVNITVSVKDPQHGRVFTDLFERHIRHLHPAPLCLTVNNLPLGANIKVAAIAKASASPKEVVRLFLTEVRSGLHPEKAALYMADTVLAHQLTSENPTTVSRTPANYTAHVKEFLALFGRFSFSITELLADGNKVYARWVQKGVHQQDIDGHGATGLPLVEYTTAVYRVENGKIAEYWLQTDRFGMEEQLKKNTLLATKAKQNRAVN